MKRIYFVREFLSYIQDVDTEIFVLDEAGKNLILIINFIGFGTSPFCNYSYAPVGEKAIKHNPKIAKNLTVCATISSHKVEMLRFFYGGGTTNEVFEEYFLQLVEQLTNSYKNKKLIIIMDNLWSHKSPLILKIL